MISARVVCRQVCLAPGLLVGLLLAGCCSFKPASPDYQPHLARAETKTNGLLTASTALLSRKEAEKMFGLPLHKKRVQPVWLRLSNQSTNPYYFLKVSLDEDYFTSAEVAYMFRKTLCPGRNRRVNEFMQDQQVSLELKPGDEVEGFVYANYSPGAKHVLIELLGDQELKRIEFTARVPGKRFDVDKVNWDELYPEEVIQDVSREELRRLLTDLPAATTDAKGKGSGDPVNLIVIGEPKDIYLAFVRQGWDPTETLSTGALFKLIGAFLFNSYWQTSPVSPLYIFGRRQDIALQKARHTIHERNHLRLWVAPYSCEGQTVWVGQISRDIGLRFTTRAPGWMTHKIDPNVDEARDYLAQDMITSHSVSEVAVVGGVGEVSPDAPRRNLTGDPYHTDGNRAVFFVSPTWVPTDQVEFIDWATEEEETYREEN